MTSIHFPVRVQSLVLAATTPIFSMAEPIVSQATAGRDASAIENFSLQHMIKPGAADSDVRTAETRAAIRPGPPAAVERRMSAARAHDCRGDLHRIGAPTLVVRGEEDTFISTATAAWHVDQIKGAKPGLETGAGHMLKLKHRRGVGPMRH